MSDEIDSILDNFGAALDAVDSGSQQTYNPLQGEIVNLSSSDARKKRKITPRTY